MSDDSSYNKKYDPDMPVIRWRQRMELATVCVANAISLCVMITRIIVQRKRFKRFRKVEWQTIIATVLLVFPLWTSQVLTNHYGSGLHVQNVPPEYAIPFWNWSLGWMSYYIVVSMVKVSVCYSLLEILPHTFRTFRRLVHLLCVVIMGLGIAEALVWTFQCEPFMSNFDYNVESTWCANIDAARFSWAGIGIGIDCILTWIPIAILQRTRLLRHERIVLRAVFGATLLGTAATAAGCYGIWLNREAQAVNDLTWTESIYIMFNSIEITLYTVGGSLTVFSRYFISRAAAYSSGARTDHSHSNSFSIFSKVSNRMRKMSVHTVTDSQLNREEPEPFNINATAPLPQWDIDGYELQQPLPPPPMTAMTALHDPEASKWHTWETSYGVPASRETTTTDLPSIEHMGVLPDVDDTPPRTREPSTTRQPQVEQQASTAWYNSEHSSEEEQPPASPQFFTGMHRPSGSRHDSPQQPRYPER
ncbi:integral membrane protein [Lasiodiplodia theobromae]|nr:integral membrane protein [Lasiodiplodia theobromae]